MEKIEDFIREKLAVTYEELIQNIALSKDEMDKSLKDLTKNKVILTEERNNNIYYILNDGQTVDEFEHSYRTFGKIMINMKEINKSLETKTENLNKDINHFYINIITIMGIFVAVFSLIFTNMKEIPIVAADPTLSAIGTCLIIDISVIIIIAAMLILIKRVIISPKVKN